MSHGPAVEVLAEYVVPEGRTVTDSHGGKVAVAVRQKHLLGTAFHPELTADNRWHCLFVAMCEETAAPGAAPASAADSGCLPLIAPPPLPVF